MSQWALRIDCSAWGPTLPFPQNGTLNRWLTSLCLRFLICKVGLKIGAGSWCSAHVSKVRTNVLAQASYSVNVSICHSSYPPYIEGLSAVSTTAPPARGCWPRHSSPRCPVSVKTSGKPSQLVVSEPVFLLSRVLVLHLVNLWMEHLVLFFTFYWVLESFTSDLKLNLRNFGLVDEMHICVLWTFQVSAFFCFSCLWFLRIAFSHYFVEALYNGIDTTDKSKGVQWA